MSHACIKLDSGLVDIGPFIVTLDTFYSACLVCFILLEDLLRVCKYSKQRNDSISGLYQVCPGSCGMSVQL